MAKQDELFRTSYGKTSKNSQGILSSDHRKKQDLWKSESPAILRKDHRKKTRSPEIKSIHQRKSIGKPGHWYEQIRLFPKSKVARFRVRCDQQDGAEKTVRQWAFFTTRTWCLTEAEFMVDIYDIYIYISYIIYLYISYLYIYIIYLYIYLYIYIYISIYIYLYIYMFEGVKLNQLKNLCTTFWSLLWKVWCIISCR